MINLKSFVVMLPAVLWMVACSDTDKGGSGGDVIGRYDEDGTRYSPTELGAEVEFMPSMNAESVRIVNVDAALNPVDSFEVPVDSVDWYSKGFSLGSRDYEYPYMKLVTIFPYGKNSKMEFVQYYKLSSYNKHVMLQIYGAIISGRVETLVREEKYSLSDAIDKAYEELEKALGTEINWPESRSFTDRSVYQESSLFDYWPYVLCRHEVSDSVFYSDFKELRDGFAKKGTIGSSMKVRAADAWLSTFSIDPDSSFRIIFKSKSRDTSYCLKQLDTAFFSWTYGLDGKWKNKDSIKINAESSKFNGRMFVYESGYWENYYNGWRLREPLEDTLGTCLFRQSDFIETEKGYYRCRYNTFGWEKITDRDTILSNEIGNCLEGFVNGIIRSYKDTLWICYCKDDKCGWDTIKDNYKEFMPDSTVLNIDAMKRYGLCNVYDGEKKQMDNLFVHCSSEKWRQIDSMTYYMGYCTNERMSEFAQMPNGDNYRCHYDGWKKATDVEMIKESCMGNNANSYMKYGEKFYKCDGHSWQEVDESVVYAPVLKGDSCDRNHDSETKKYGDEYFVCRMLTYGYYWQKATELRKELYDVQEKYEVDCSGSRKGKSIIWDDENKSLYSCIENSKSGKYEFGKVSFSAIKEENQKKYAGGKFISDSVYEVVVDDAVYGFDHFRWKSDANEIRDGQGLITMGYLKTDKNSYVVQYIEGRWLFLYPETGKDSIAVVDIEPKSESFQNFYKSWNDWVQEGNVCKDDTEKTKYPVGKFMSVRYRDNTYMTYDQAVAECPKGFHIPDTSDFISTKLYTDVDDISSVRDVFYPEKQECMPGGKNEKHLVLFWSRNEKDADKQYCFAKTLENGYGFQMKVFECPKDLKPLVQAVYVMD